ncbi:unnamed protein product, partial [Allacma fusca]
ASLHHVEIPQADPTMIGVVIGLALMSVTLCVVLRLFAKARFRENRTIFNTPNPRLMNVSLLKGSKTLLRGNSAPRSRRGSTASGRSGIEPGTPSSPNADHGPHIHDHGNGNAMALAGSSSRPKPTRQMSSDTAGDGTPMGRPGGAVNKQKFRHQDSVASNV